MRPSTRANAFPRSILIAGLLLGACAGGADIDRVPRISASEPEIPVDEPNDEIEAAETPAAPSGETNAEEVTEEVDASGASSSDPGGFFAGQRGRIESLSVDRAYGTVLEALPNVTYTDAVNGRYTVSDFAVIGKVASVQPLAAYAIVAGETQEVQVPIGPSVVGWAAYVATIEVEEVLGTTNGDPDTVQILVVTSPAINEGDVAAALMHSERVLVVARQDNVVEGRPELYSIVAQGGFWFDVDEGQRITAPSLPPGLAARLVPPDLDVATMRAAALEAIELVPVWERN